MPKYLITGGCGFIGSHLASYLIKQGDEVRILDDLSASIQNKNLFPAEVVVGSITDPSLCKRALQGVDGCFHLAASVSVAKSCQEWYATHQINCGGSVSLFEQAAGMPIIYASSAAVYGPSDGKPLSETAPLIPQSPYAADKIACELHAQVGWHLFKTPSLGFRLFNVFGCGQNSLSSYAGVVAIFSKKILKGETVSLFGDGEQKRDFIAVADVARIFSSAMKKGFYGHEIYNLSTGIATSINQLAADMEDITGKKMKKTLYPSRIGDICYSCGDPTKLEKMLHLKTELSLKEGLVELLGVSTCA